jgi:hypothetical protein
LNTRLALQGPELTDYSCSASGSGEGAWTIAAAIDEASSMPVVSAALIYGASTSAARQMSLTGFRRRHGAGVSGACESGETARPRDEQHVWRAGTLGITAGPPTSSLFPPYKHKARQEEHDGNEAGSRSCNRLRSDRQGPARSMTCCGRWTSS